MAKTTPSKPKNKPKNGANGPVLVDEPSTQPAAEEEIPPAEDFSEEPETETTEQAEQTAPDPRRVAPANNLTGPQLWAFIKQYPAPEDLDLYAYRLFPVIKALPPADWTGEGKPPTFQEKLKGLITEQTNQVADYEWLRDVRGSGTYHIRLIDRRLKRTQNRQVTEAKVEVNEWNTHPPVLNDWSELVPCEANKWIIQRLLKEKVIRRTPEGGFVAYEMMPDNSPNQANGGGSTAELRMLQMLERAYQNKPAPPVKEESPFAKIDLVNLIDKTQQQNDPVKALSSVKDILTTLRENEPKRDPDAQIKLFIQMAEILKPPPPPAPVAPPDPVAQMKQTAEMAKIMKEAFGPSEEERTISTKMNGWQEFLRDPLTELINGMKPLFAVGAQFLMLKAQQGNQAQQQPPAPRPAPAPQPATVAQSPVSGQQPTQPPAPAQQPVEEPPAEMITPAQQQEQAEARALLTGLAYVMPTMLDYLQSKDLTGEDFGAWFCDTKVPTGFPPPLPRYVAGIDALSLVQKYPPDRIVELIELNSPPMYADLVPTPDKRDALLQFIQQFQSFNPEGEPEPVKKGKK